MTEYVLHADLDDRNGAFLGNNVSNCGAKSADNAVFLNGDDPAGLLCCLDDDVAVDGLDGVDIDNASVNALLLECLAASRASDTIRPVAMIVTSLPSLSWIPLPTSNL